LGLLAARRSLLEDRHRLSRAVKVGALAGLAALAVHSAVDFNLRIPSNALLAVFLLACALAPTDADGGRSERTPPARRWPSYGFVALATGALVMAIVARWPDRQLDAHSLLRTSPGTTPLRAGSLEASLDAHLARRPADAAAWLALAWVRAPRSPTDAAALGSWALRLDPLNPGLRQAAAMVPFPPPSSAPGAASSRASAAPRSAR